MILHDCTADFEESEESEPELTGDNDSNNNNNNNNSNDNPNSPQKTNHHLDNASPTPNLEYRSYTPTYEEELRRYRKSSRGGSIENLNKIDKDIEMEKSERENRNLGENTFSKEDMDDSTSMTCRKHDTNTAATSTTTVANHNTDSSTSGGNNSISNNVGLREAKPPPIPVGSGNSDKNNNKLSHIPPKTNDATTNNNNMNINQKNESDETQSLLSSNNTPVVTTSDTTATGHHHLLGRLRSRKQTIMAFLDSLNLDSRQNDGSPAEDIDANMEEFLRVPYRIEEIMAFGILICTDSFLHVLTVTPLKFIWSCLCLVCTIINPGKGIGWCRFHRRHLYQFVRVFVIYAVYRYCLSPISIGKMVSADYEFFLIIVYEYTRSFIHYVMKLLYISLNNVNLYFDLTVPLDPRSSNA